MRYGKRAAPDVELRAIRRIMGILEELDPFQRERVFSYLIHRSDEWRPGSNARKSQTVPPAGLFELLTPPPAEPEGAVE